MKIFRIKFTLVLFTIIQKTLDYNIEMNVEKIDFIKKNENNYNFCSTVYLVYYRL